MFIHGVSAYCSKDSMIKWAIANQAKGRNKIKKVERKATRQRTKELMTRIQWFSKLQRLINQWVVHVRDKGKPCYTCGTSKPNIKYDCGHRWHAGRGGGDRRRFILENLHKQCSMQCNQFGGGMLREYDLALDIEYGEGFADKLACVANYPELKEQFPNWQDIEAEIIRYRAILRDNGIKPNV